MHSTRNPEERGGGPHRKAGRQREILDAAVRAFSRHGYYSCTMANVAREAGVADGTLYLYVQGKQELLVLTFRYVLDRILTRLDAELAAIADPAAKLERLMELHLDVMETDPDLAGFLQFQLRQPDPVIRSAIREPLTSYARRIEAVIEEGKAKGVFRADVGTRAMRRVVFGALDETVSAWWFRQTREPLRPKAGALFETILHGIAVRAVPRAENAPAGTTSLR